jgi:hypothetical protein
MLNPGPRADFATYQSLSKQNRWWIKIHCRLLKVRQPNSSTTAKRRPLLIFFLQKPNEAENVDGKNRPEPMLLRNWSWINYRCWIAILQTEKKVFFALYLTGGALRSLGIWCFVRPHCDVN